jgi:DNA-directed RNA polymerase subunit K/omega
MEWAPEGDELFDEDIEIEEPLPPPEDEPTSELQFMEEPPPNLTQRFGADRQAPPILDQYSKTALIATRARQLASGDRPRIPDRDIKTGELSEIARLELERGVLPLKIIRSFSDGTYEEWSISEFEQIAE